MAGAVGEALGGAADLAARARGAKPLHPRGVVLPGVLIRDGRGASGVPWLDGVGQTAVLVRISRAGGLPPGWPDVHGLAVRIPPESGGGADRPFGSLLVGGGGAIAHDPAVRFEPTRTLRDLPAYPWLARLRDPSYVSARRGYPATDTDPSAHHLATADRSTVAPTPTRETR